MKKNKKNKKVLIFGLIALIIITTTITLISLKYSKLEVIGRDPISRMYMMFNRNIHYEDIPANERLSPLNKVTTKKWLSSSEDYKNLLLKEYPVEIYLNCHQRNNFEITLENNGQFPISDINVIADNSELVFEFPEDIVIPPNSNKTITVFVTPNCSYIKDSELTSKITIANKYSIDIRATIRGRAE